MSYKTILVYVDASHHLAKRVMFAAKIAQHQESHLVGVAVTGISRLLQLPSMYAADSAPSTSDENASLTSQFAENGNPYKPEYMAALKQRAQLSLDEFTRLTQHLGAASVEQKLIDDDASDAISSQGVYADLIVLGQNEANHSEAMAKVDFPEYVALHSSCPVLIVPNQACTETVGDTVLIAWNGSDAAARAVRNAMPFLKRAKHIKIALFNANKPIEQVNSLGQELQEFLHRHHLQVELIRRDVTVDIGNALMSLAVELNADLIVMGCVAHQRWRGVLLGRSTRVVLENATIPVLMSH